MDSNPCMLSDVVTRKAVQADYSNAGLDMTIAETTAGPRQPSLPMKHLEMAVKPKTFQLTISLAWLYQIHEGSLKNAKTRSQTSSIGVIRRANIGSTRPHAPEDILSLNLH